MRSRSKNSFVSADLSYLDCWALPSPSAVLIVVLSVVNGFERELRDRLLAMSAHASIENADGQLNEWQQRVSRANQNERVRSAAPYVNGQGASP